MTAANIDTERIAQEKPAAAEKCLNCGGVNFWQRPAGKWGPAELLCCRCHPEPGENK
jgi:hypothetical protein